MHLRSLKQIHTWRVPPNWSPREWFEELRAEVVAAAWEAELDFDPTRGVPLAAFVYQRVWAGARRRYRREWSYFLRCGFHLEDDDCNDATANGCSSVDDSESVRKCLRRLSKPQRLLIEDLYWKGMTIVEVARTLSVSPPAISRRKRQALAKLRRWMDQSKGNDSSRN